jgi:hypothetical protein
MPLGKILRHSSFSPTLQCDALSIGTGFHCYRAIDAMMQSMKDIENDKDEAAWTRLRDRLRVKRTPIDVVKAHADLPRHGKARLPGSA